MEKVKETIHKVTHPSEHKNTTTSDNTLTGNTTTGTHSGHHGHHGHHDQHNAGVTGTSGTAGPHSSNLANKADPRVDSDMDGSRNAGAASYGPGGQQNTGYGNTGSGLTGSHNTAGPHSSDLINKVDPRVDSDLDGSRNAGAASYGTGASGNYGSGTTGTGFGSSNTNTTGAGFGSSNNNTYGTSGSTNAGPHSSNLANKLDPRVDSDLDSSRNAGAASHGTTGNYGTSGTTGAGYSSGTTGTGYGSTTAGPHSSNLANKADPRVDSDMDGSRNAGAASYGAGVRHHQAATSGLNSGPAPNTAGPHSNDMLNKLDPRVDSDRDGSRTVGSAPNNSGSTY